MVIIMFLMTSGDFQERRVLKAEQERAEAVAARCFFIFIFVATRCFFYIFVAARCYSDQSYRHIVW